MSIQYLRITINGVAHHVPLDVPEGCKLPELEYELAIIYRRARA